MPLKQLHIQPEGGAQITVDYNPEEYTLNNENAFAVQGIPGLGSPVVQFVNGGQRTLEVELFFDTYDTPDLPKDDVRTQTGAVVALLGINGEQHSPPILRVTLASLDLRCVLSRVSEKFQLFMPDGTPVRARLACTFIEVVDPELAAQAANLQTADFTKAHIVVRGETLSSIAALRYDDAQRWRPIALANGIADPLALSVGQTLRIPSLPYYDVDTGEVVV
jgi:nucleoid-associated protein YgaU